MKREKRKSQNGKLVHDNFLVNNHLAKIISIILHPLVMPTIIFYLLYHYALESLMPMSSVIFQRILQMIFIITFFLPLVSVLMMRINDILAYFKFRNSDEKRREASVNALLMNDKRDRVVPFIFVAIIYGLSAYLFLVKIHTNPIFGIILASITFTLVLTTLITQSFKISMHSAGISGVVGFLMAVSFRYPDNQLFYPIIIMILLAGVAMTARLQLNAHTTKEVITGALLGFLVSFFAILVFA